MYKMWQYKNMKNDWFFYIQKFVLEKGEKLYF